MKQSFPKESLFECIASTMNTEPGRGRKRTMVQAEHLDEGKLLRIMSFFGTDELQARILSLIVMRGYKDSSFDESEVLEFCQLGHGSLLRVRQLLAGYCGRGWIKATRNNEDQISREYEACPPLFNAVLYEKKSMLRKPRIRTEADFLQAVGKLLEQGRAGSITLRSATLSSLMKLHHRYQHLPLPAKIQELKLTPVETGLLYYTLHAHLQGEEEPGIKEYTQAIFEQHVERLEFLQAAKARQLSVQMHDLIEFQFYAIMSNSDVKATPKLLEMLLPKGQHKSNHRFSGKTCDHIPASSITTRILLFDEALRKQIEDIRSVLDAHRLPAVQDALRKQGLQTGIISLFHGAPGTGKTASAFQLAAQTGRDILKVNISAIRTKWVGDSEKNVSAIFSEYKTMLSRTDITPILLLNEADALLARRRVVETSVDQMNNAMQNIFLEELEHFEGILIATTNLTKNLDDAFERRFLYKLRFENPIEHNQLAIWLQHFPEADSSILQAIQQEYDLSPAQIENIRRKYAIETTIQGEFQPDLGYLRRLANQESINPKVKRQAIGFRTTNQAS